MRLAGVVAVTPVRANRALNDEARAHVFSKDERLQTTGSFKLRGAWNALAARKSQACIRGVVTYSSGKLRPRARVRRQPVPAPGRGSHARRHPERQARRHARVRRDDRDA
jgi:hypothetical protein